MLRDINEYQCEKSNCDKKIISANVLSRGSGGLGNVVKYWVQVATSPFKGESYSRYSSTAIISIWFSIEGSHLVVKASSELFE